MRPDVSVSLAELFGAQGTSKDAIRPPGTIAMVKSEYMDSLSIMYFAKYKPPV